MATATEEEPYESASDASFESVDISDVDVEDVPSDSAQRSSKGTLTQADYAKESDKASPLSIPRARKSVPSLAQSLAQMRASREKRLSLSSNSQSGAAASSFPNRTTALVKSQSDSERSDYSDPENPALLVPKKPASAAQRRSLHSSIAKEHSVTQNHGQSKKVTGSPSNSNIKVTEISLVKSRKPNDLADEQYEDVDVDMEDVGVEEVGVEDILDNDTLQNIDEEIVISAEKQLPLSHITPTSDINDEPITGARKSPRTRNRKSAISGDKIPGATSTNPAQNNSKDSEEDASEVDDGKTLDKSHSKSSKRESARRKTNAKKKRADTGSDKTARENKSGTAGKDSNFEEIIVDSDSDVDQEDSDDEVIFHSNLLPRHSGSTKTRQSNTERQRAAGNLKKSSSNVKSKTSSPLLSPKKLDEKLTDDETTVMKSTTASKETEVIEPLSSKELDAEPVTKKGSKSKSNAKKQKGQKSDVHIVTDQEEPDHAEIKKVVSSKKKRSVLAKTSGEASTDDKAATATQVESDANGHSELSKRLKKSAKRSLKPKSSPSAEIEKGSSGEMELSNEAREASERSPTANGSRDDAELPSAASVPKKRKASGKGEISKLTDPPAGSLVDKPPVSSEFLVLEGTLKSAGHIKIYKDPENGKPFYFHPGTGKKIAGGAAAGVLRTLQKEAAKDDGAVSVPQKGATYGGDPYTTDDVTTAAPSKDSNETTKASGLTRKRVAKRSTNPKVSKHKEAQKKSLDDSVPIQSHGAPGQTSTTSDELNREVGNKPVQSDGGKAENGDKPVVTGHDNAGVQQTKKLKKSRKKDAPEATSPSKINSARDQSVSNTESRREDKSSPKSGRTENKAVAVEIAAGGKEEGKDSDDMDLASDEDKVNSKNEESEGREIGTTIPSDINSHENEDGNTNVGLGRMDGTSSKGRRASEPWRAVSSNKRRRSYGSSTINALNMHHGKQLFQKVENHFELFTQRVHEAIDQFVVDCKEEMGGMDDGSDDASRPWKASRKQRLEVRVKAMEKEAQLQMWDCMKRLASGIAGVIDEEAVPDLSLADTFGGALPKTLVVGESDDSGEHELHSGNALKRKWTLHNVEANANVKETGESLAKRSKLFKKRKHNLELEQSERKFADGSKKLESDGRSHQVHWKDRSALHVSTDDGHSETQSAGEDGTSAGVETSEQGSKSRRKAGTTPVKLIHSGK